MINDYLQLLVTWTKKNFKRSYDKVGLFLKLKWFFSTNLTEFLNVDKNWERCNNRSSNNKILWIILFSFFLQTIRFFYKLPIFLEHSFFILQGSYQYVYMGPLRNELDLPENENYNPDHERLFPSNQGGSSNAGKLCEKGKTSWIITLDTDADISSLLMIRSSFTTSSSNWVTLIIFYDEVSFSNASI